MINLNNRCCIEGTVPADIVTTFAQQNLVVPQAP